MRKNIIIGLTLAIWTSLSLCAQTPIVQDPPDGTLDGVNILSPTSVIIQLRAPGKEYVHLRGSFNGFAINDESLMHVSQDGNRHWLQVDGLNGYQNWLYHFLIEGNLEVGDPYATLVVDPWNDGYIPDDHFPNMPEFPFADANWPNGVFRTMPPAFNWTDEDYVKPSQDQLVIYELLIRDFDEGQTYHDVIDRLDYLEWLGINAIELMPVSEFDGNLSWGYNPSFRMAPDKFYGTGILLKSLVNAAHERGIAVIMDIVPNHSFGLDPMVRMYQNPDGSVAENNPWFNEVAMHPFSPGYDFNHSDPWTVEHWKRIFDYWLDEYHLDGYRIDLSKGLTQNYSGSDVGQWNQYDQGRIDILFNYANHVWAGHPSAYMILEHLGDNAEETVLANGGFMLWGKMTTAYTQATLGYGGDLNWGVWSNRGWNWPNLVTYFESHDEQRFAHDIQAYGASNGTYNVQEFATAMDRIALAHAFLICAPGPKMMWQQGELGYDLNLFDCGNGTFAESCKLDEKPSLWEYLEIPERVELVKRISAITQLKTHQPVFSSWDFNVDLAGEGKRIHLYSPTQNAVIIGNFATTGISIVPGLPYPGTWHDYLTGEVIDVSDLNDAWYLEPGEFRILMDTPLPVPDLNPNTPLQIDTGCTNIEAVNYDPEATADDGSCLFSVVFSVDLGTTVADAMGVHLAGNFQGWDASATPMDWVQDNVWEAEVALAPGSTYVYKFINGNAWGQDEGVPEACGAPNGLGGFNRTWEFSSIEVAGPGTVCWSSCEACASGNDDAGAVYCGPGTAWDPELQLCVGESTSTLCAEDVNQDGMVTIADLLQLLSAFGDGCSE